MLVLLDPHVDDTIYKPLSYWMLKKRPFKKYSYINDAITKNQELTIHFTYNYSSFPKRITNKLPQFIKRIIIQIEIFLWKKINKIKFKEINESKIEKDKHNAFVFGKRKEGILALRGNKFNKVYYHLSHYHGLDKIEAHLAQNVFFCADNNIKNHKYFKNKFSWYNKEIIIVPFFAESRFKNLNKERLNSCAVTGTYHDINKKEIDFGIYNSKGNTTLHPLRYDIAQSDIEGLVSRLSLFEKKDLFKKQKKYFSFDIVEFYNSHKYALIPGEGNGLIAIGSLESYASGCDIFLTEWEASGLFDENEYFKYNGELNDFIKKFKSVRNKRYELNSPIRDKFSYEKSIIRFQENILNG